MPNEPSTPDIPYKRSTPNTPFPDIVFVASNTPQKMQLKIGWYVSQGYRLTGTATRFEDITMDLEAVGKSKIELPRASSAVAILMRNDPT